VLTLRPFEPDLDDASVGKWEFETYVWYSITTFQQGRWFFMCARHVHEL